MGKYTLISMQHSLHLYHPVILPRDYLTGEAVQLNDVPIEKNWKSHLRIMPTSSLLGYSSYSRPSNTITSLLPPPPSHLRQSLHPSSSYKKKKKKKKCEKEDGLVFPIVENEKQWSCPTMDIVSSTTTKEELNITGTTPQHSYQTTTQPCTESNLSNPFQSSIPSSFGLSLDRLSPSNVLLSELSPTTTLSSYSDIPMTTLLSIDSHTVIRPLPARSYYPEHSKLIGRNHHILSYSNSPSPSVRLSLNSVSQYPLPPPTSSSSPFDLTLDHTVHSGSLITRTSSYPHMRNLFSDQSDEWGMNEGDWMIVQQLDEVFGKLAIEEVIEDRELMEVVSVTQAFQNSVAGK